MEFKTQKEMFLWIYENREWKSEISGNPLPHINHPQWHWCFGHILGKQAYPEYKFREDNIILMTPSEHEKQESFEIFRERQQKMKEKYYQEKRLKLI